MKISSTRRYLIPGISVLGTSLLAAAFLAGCAKAPPTVSLPEPVPVTSFAGNNMGYLLVTNSAPSSGSTTVRSISAPIGAEEIWIIARSSDTTTQPSDASPGSGALMTKVDEKEIPMPLKHTDVRASVSGFIGSVEVVQQFQNPYSSKIEAVYVFPLPHNAAVNEFIMTIGERRIRGIIRERKEAEEIYRQAKSQGYVTTLLTEERPNVFTQSVANIEPNKEIDVTIKYFHAMEYTDGWYEFVFPMVVGPRYNPPGTTNGVDAVPRGSTSVS